jgi:hypothetical protein
MEEIELLFDFLDATLQHPNYIWLLWQKAGYNVV